MKYKIYLLKGEHNNATSNYISIIKEGLESAGKEVEIVNKVSLIERDDIVLTITAKAFAAAWLRNPKQKFISWFQGIAPEEVDVMFAHKTVERILKKIFYGTFERLAMKKCQFAFFVSDAMVRHYKAKYGYQSNNYIVMPCFNMSIDSKAFNKEHYSKPTFVFAGHIFPWQCLEETLQLFVEIKKRLPKATLTLLCDHKQEARALLDKYGLCDSEIDYVPLNVLGDKLAEFKYGFIIRNDIEVNRVATPTKLNSYLSAGIIPIFSDVISDFKDKINGNVIKLPSHHSWSEAADIIAEFDKKEISSEDIYANFNSIFQTYYSREYYLEKIKKIFSEM